MNTALKYYRCRIYNKRKKPWRSLIWAFKQEKKRSKLLFLLCCCLLIEAAVFFPRERERICSKLVKLYDVKEELMEETITGTSSLEEVDGEVRERGFFMDLKEGELKYWQKVERKTLQESD